MKKLLTIILTFLISFASLPVYALADETAEITENQIAEQNEAIITDSADEPVAYAAASSSGGQWVQESNGRWWYKHADGSYTKYDWEYINGSWYFFDKNGWMWTEWLQWEGNWYYLNPSGVMCTGWIKVNNKWYYMNADGSMRVGWIKLDGEWYYLNTDGSMQIGWKTINGSWYYFNSSGRMVRETLVQGKRTYNFLSSGELNSTIMAIDRIYQGNTNWCWAASAAMIGNCENNSNLTMKNVVYAIKHSYDEEAGANNEECLLAMVYSLPQHAPKPMNEFKFETFVWYVNKNHPIFTVLATQSLLDGGRHAVVCAGYRQSDKSLYYIDPEDFINKKFVPYSNFAEHNFFDSIFGYTGFNFIIVYP